MAENSKPDPSVTGGCQCGALRYVMHVPRVENAHACHCRMCQKATGGLFAALAGCPKDRLEWTRGQPAFFASSNVASRGFCPDCGTPLTFAYNRPDARIYVTIGSLDDPEQAVIGKQYGVESRLSWVSFCEDVAQERSGESAEEAAFFASIRSNQAGRAG